MPYKFACGIVISFLDSVGTKLCNEKYWPIIPRLCFHYFVKSFFNCIVPLALSRFQLHKVFLCFYAMNIGRHVFWLLTSLVYKWEELEPYRFETVLVTVN